LPDRRDRYPAFSTSDSLTGGTVNSGLPNITGEFSLVSNEFSNSIIATNNELFTADFNSGRLDPGLNTVANKRIWEVFFDASKSNSIYGASTKVIPQSFYGTWAIFLYL